jgi:hypothetical protein
MSKVLQVGILVCALILTFWVVSEFSDLKGG